MNRRSFIINSTVFSVTALLPFGFISCTTEFDILATPQELLKIMSKDTISNIGKEYMDKVPTESQKDILITLLSPDKEHDILILEKIITNDFISGNTVIIDGWILSQTEARQCALYTLIN